MRPQGAPPGWLSASWLAQELVRTDDFIALAKERGQGTVVFILGEYRDVICETRSAVLRSRAVPSWWRCHDCGRLIAEACPYCAVTWEQA